MCSKKNKLKNGQDTFGKLEVVINHWEKAVNFSKMKEESNELSEGDKAKRRCFYKS